MIDIQIAQKDWGGCDICIDFKKIDFLPRITLSELTGCLFLSIGFLMINFTLCIFDSAMRNFMKDLNNGELEKELDAQLKELRTLNDYINGTGNKEDKDSSLGDGERSE